MKKAKMINVAVAVLLVLGSLLYFYSVSSGQKNNKQSVARAEPKEQAEAETPTVEIPEDRQKLIGVKKADVIARPLHHIIRAVGKIEYDERRLATVNTRFEGWVEKLYVDFTGRYVKTGEPLAEIYSPELVATQQEFLNSLKYRPKSDAAINNSQLGNMFSRDAESMADAARQRLRLWNISEAQIKKIEEAGKPLKTVTIHSPASGFVVQKMALKGMRVMPGEKLFDIADISTVWVVADIYENDLPLIKTGQAANITLSHFPGKEFSAAIDYLYPALAGETRTAKVRFSLPNPNGALKPQMFANVSIKIDIGKRLSIPVDAVIDTGLRQIVYVDKGEGYFEPREVRLGVRAEGFREVLSGLKAGEKVAASATFLIDSEAQLKGVTPLKAGIRD